MKPKPGPCPFCLHDKIVSCEVSEGVAEEVDGIALHCKKCGAVGPLCSTVAKAVKAWNDAAPAWHLDGVCARELGAHQAMDMLLERRVKHLVAWPTCTCTLEAEIAVLCQLLKRTEGIGAVRVLLQAMLSAADDARTGLGSSDDIGPTAGSA